MSDLEFRVFDGQVFIYDIAIVQGKGVPHGYLASWWNHTYDNPEQLTSLVDDDDTKLWEGDIISGKYIDKEEVMVIIKAEGCFCAMPIGSKYGYSLCEIHNRKKLGTIHTSTYLIGNQIEWLKEQLEYKFK